MIRRYLAYFVCAAIFPAFVVCLIAAMIAESIDQEAADNFGKFLDKLG